MCPDKSILSAWFDGEVDSIWSGRINDHLITCESCSSYIGNLEKQKELLQTAPLPDFKDSLDRVKGRIRERRTVLGSLRFWEKKISLPTAAAAAVIAASVTLGINILAMNRGVNPHFTDSGISDNRGYLVDLPGEKLNEIFSMMETPDSDLFASNSIVTLPADINLIFHGDSQLVRSAGFYGDESR